MTTFLRSRAQDRDVVQEVGGHILSALSNILNASADITGDSYNQRIEKQGEAASAERVRRRAGQENTTGKEFVRVNKAALCFCLVQY